MGWYGMRMEMEMEMRTEMDWGERERGFFPKNGFGAISSHYLFHIVTGKVKATVIAIVMNLSRF